MGKKSSTESFYRIIELPLKPGDSFRGYQTERIELKDNKIVKRALCEKPNLFEYAQSLMLDLMDPRNHVTTADAAEFV